MKQRHFLAIILVASILFLIVSTDFALAAGPTPDGRIEDIISWTMFDDALQDHWSDIKSEQTNKAYRLAIIDTGFDWASRKYWGTVFSDDIYESSRIKLFDFNGNEHVFDEEVSSTAFDYGMDGGVHHGTVIMGIILQLLYSYEGTGTLDYSISMFAVDDTPTSQEPSFEEQVEDHLDRIYTHNQQNPNSKYKVLSMSVAQDYSSYSIYDEELWDVASQSCLIFAATGNYDQAWRSTSDAQDKAIADKKKYPAADANVIGVGALYGEKGYKQGSINCKVRRCSTKEEQRYITTTYYFGSQYSSVSKVVDLVAPGFEVDIVYDIHGDDAINPEALTTSNPDGDWYVAHGTSLSTPVVATAAYLADRLSRKTGHGTLSFSDLKDIILITCEDDEGAYGQSSYYKKKWELTDKPIKDNSDASDFRFYSYRVGHGCLDVHDMFEYVSDPWS
ncbi:MAG: S8/S53 family peptidase [Candidatus Heimdallarchaeota archaeon]|nr:S8/S53 family peptidase [Candidatus Heimdallarchaeota archaeon]MCK4954051.1 S8/S53 family peptidase [Candidatus Heimdallarchaeota archaeon]